MDINSQHQNENKGTRGQPKEKILKEIQSMQGSKDFCFLLSSAANSADVDVKSIKIISEGKWNRKTTEYLAQLCNEIDKLLVPLILNLADQER